jgi:hypothetical protein
MELISLTVGCILLRENCPAYLVEWGGYLNGCDLKERD